MERMPYPHSGENISTFLQEKVKEFNLEGKITCVVTDNGSNMVKAIKLWDGVERLPCAAHTLQLSINHAFKKSNTYIKRIKQLVKFFTKSPKQSEHLDRAQKECRYQNNNDDFDDSSDDNSDIEDNNENEDENNNNNNNEVNINNNSEELVLRNIVDVKTRWNSKYYSWQRLFKLRKSIEWLSATLPLSDNSNDRADGRKLKNLLLKPHEWDLLKQIIDLLEPFDDATTYFSGTSYATLSIISPVIQALKYNYIYILSNDNSNENNSNGDNNDENNNNRDNSNENDNSNEQCNYIFIILFNILFNIFN